MKWAAIWWITVLACLAAVTVIAWLDDEPFRTRLTSDGFTFAPAPARQDGAVHAFCVDADLLRIASASLEPPAPRPPGGASWTEPQRGLGQLDLSPPSDPACAALAVSLSPDVAGSSTLRLTPRPRPGRPRCEDPWLLTLQRGQDGHHTTPLADGASVVLRFKNPTSQSPHVLTHFTAAALHSGQLMDAKAGAILATRADIVGGVEVLRLTAVPRPPGAGSGLAMEATVSAAGLASVKLNDYELGWRRLFQKYVGAAGVFVGLLGFVAKVCGVADAIRSFCRRSRRQRAPKASPAPTSGAVSLEAAAEIPESKPSSGEVESET